MKTVLAFFLLASIGVTACNSGSNTSAADKKESTDSNNSQTSATSINSQGNSEINNLVSAYLQLKNALANDNSKDAASAADVISQTLKTADVNRLSTEEKKMYQEVADDMKEHAEHIAANPDKIAHQREHFETMSKDLYDLVKVAKQDRTLFKDFCPMYNNEKGGMWISETKDIKNPYMGKKMTECGEMQEEIRSK